jgi:Trypsin-like peptidase domain
MHLLTLVSAQKSRSALLAVWLLGPLWPAGAQAPGVAIEAEQALSMQPALIAKGKALLATGKLLDVKKVNAQLKKPQPAPIELAAVQAKELSGREVAARARQGLMRVGWFYRCVECERWHFNFANGYAISASGAVATCWHCVEPTPGMREGYLVALDPAGELLPVSAILAANSTLDAVLLQVEGGHFSPLALNDQLAPGDPAFCLSDPFDQSGYFSSGIVNRFYWLNDKGAEARTLAGVASMRLNVSTDWAPGSSGAAVLDRCGNAIGHVSVIYPLSEEEVSGVRPSTRGRSKKKPAEPLDSTPLIILHEAVPARGVLLLAQSMKPNF